MDEQLLWDIEETARQLGGVSTRTVRRLIMRGELPAVRVGRRVSVPAAGVHTYIERNMQPAHNTPRAEPGVREGGNNACHTVARNPPSGGSITSMQAAKELAAVLELPIARKQRR